MLDVSTERMQINRLRLNGRNLDYIFQVHVVKQNFLEFKRQDSSDNFNSRHGQFSNGPQIKQLQASKR
jgi:hypothetical protein